MSERFAVVSGTSKGLGEAMALYLLEQGFTVFGVSRSGSQIENGHFIDLIGDIRIESEVEEMYEIIREKTEQLHLVVLNAGILTLDTVFETSTKDFKNNLDTNVIGQFHMLKHLADFIMPNETHVIVVSSLAAKKTFPNMAAYTASKCAMEALVQTCKEEWNELGVRFSTLYPGPIDTGLWKDLDLGEEQNFMLSVEDFLFVFDSILRAPPNLQVHSMIFGHHQGPIG